jgi:hypothetical protein
MRGASLPATKAAECADGRASLVASFAAGAPV